MRREGKPHILHTRRLWWCTDDAYDWARQDFSLPFLGDGRGFSPTAAYVDWISRLAQFMGAEDPYGRR